jgi:hypothetical protein
MEKIIDDSKSKNNHNQMIKILMKLLTERDVDLKISKYNLAICIKIHIPYPNMRDCVKVYQKYLVLFIFK